VNTHRYRFRVMLCAFGLWSIPAQSQDDRDRILYSTETEHFKPLTRKLVKNVWMDQKDIWTSPLRVRTAEDALPWILVGAGTAGLIASDHWTARQLPNTVDQISISKDVSQLGAGYTVLPIAAGFYIGGAFAHNEKARETGILSGEAILDAVIVGEVFKLATQRQRPLDGNGNGEFFKGGSSFPSGHAAISWALASVVAHEYNQNVWYPITAYGLASLVSLSRLSGQQHFPSDVLAGSALGWFVGRYVFKTHEDHSIHRRPDAKLSRLRPQVMPRFDSQMRGVVLSWSQ
jgi:membrane-associated phospholipid phosphatase